MQDVQLKSTNGFVDLDRQFQALSESDAEQFGTTPAQSLVCYIPVARSWALVDLPTPLTSS